MADLTVYRNKRMAFAVNFDTDLTNYSGVYFMVKSAIGLADSEAVIDKIMVVEYPETGEANLTLEPEDVDLTPDTYYYDVQAVSNSTTDSTLTLSGTLTVLPSVRHDNPTPST